MGRQEIEIEVEIRVGRGRIHVADLDLDLGLDLGHVVVIRGERVGEIVAAIIVGRSVDDDRILVHAAGQLVR